MTIRRTVATSTSTIIPYIAAPFAADSTKSKLRLFSGQKETGLTEIAPVSIKHFILEIGSITKRRLDDTIPQSVASKVGSFSLRSCFHCLKNYTIIDTFSKMKVITPKTTS